MSLAIIRLRFKYLHVLILRIQKLMYPNFSSSKTFQLKDHDKTKLPSEQQIPAAMLSHHPLGYLRADLLGTRQTGHSLGIQ